MIEEWDGRERRRRRECWDGKTEKRKTKMAVIEEKKNGGIKIPVWVIPIVVTIILSLTGYLTSWGAMNTQVAKHEEKIEEIEKILPVVAQQQIIIPEIQKTTDQVRVAQISFNEKYDRNRESDQKFFQELLREVKKA